MKVSTSQNVPIETSQSVAAIDRQHFEFGKNWAGFLERFDEDRLAAACRSLRKLFRVEDLSGYTFLDAGCGSGLFSFAARKLGASVRSFDFDQNSVACANYLREREGGGSSGWQITAGSLLDGGFMSGIGVFDIVYCWGVAHHTGAMWQALENLSHCVKESGLLVVGIYNDEGYVSHGWRLVKLIYQRLPRCLRPIYVGMVGMYFPIKRVLPTVLACGVRLLSLRNPLSPIVRWIEEIRNPLQGARGMVSWTDLTDWVGGWPYEVSRPEFVFRFFRDRGFLLEEMTTSSGHGCNEFVFRRQSSVVRSAAVRDGE